MNVPNLPYLRGVYLRSVWRRVNQQWFSNDNLRCELFFPNYIIISMPQLNTTLLHHCCRGFMTIQRQKIPSHWVLISRFVLYWDLRFSEPSCKDHGTMMIKAFYNSCVATFLYWFCRVGCGWCQGHTVTLPQRNKQTLKDMLTHDGWRTN